MKYLFFLYLFFQAACIYAQKSENYYDHNWKLTSNPAEASYYSLVEKKDSFWIRSDYYAIIGAMQMQGTYKDPECSVKHGSFIYYHSNRRCSSVESYSNGKKDGLKLSFYSNGMLRDSMIYVMGLAQGIGLSWHQNGMLSDSVTYLGLGKSSHISWYDNGNLSSAGFLVKGKMQGKWKYYHRNGNPAAVELYDYGNLVSREYVSENGERLTDTTSRDCQASYVDGKKAMYNLLTHKISFPEGLKFANAGKGVVIVKFSIDEAGNMKDQEVVLPLHPSFDAMALESLNKISRWNPAVSHNRTIKTTVLLPVSFLQK